MPAPPSGVATAGAGALALVAPFPAADGGV
jgi:hypothetical protein